MNARAIPKGPRPLAASPVPAPTGSARHYLSVLDLRHDELDQILTLAARFKRERAAGVRSEQPLEGRHVALLFEKPSLRTRTTFTIAVRELGGVLRQVCVTDLAVERLIDVPTSGFRLEQGLEGNDA